MVAAVSVPALATWNWSMGTDVPAVAPLAQVIPELFVRSDGTNTAYWLPSW